MLHSVSGLLLAGHVVDEIHHTTAITKLIVIPEKGEGVVRGGESIFTAEYEGCIQWSLIITNSKGPPKFVLCNRRSY